MAGLPSKGFSFIMPKPSLPSLDRLLCELIAVPSLASDHQACTIALNICRNCIDDLPGVSVHEYVVDGQPSLVATYKADKDPDVLMVCHADVVPAPPSAFAPEIQGSTITGRGAIDMKGPTSAMIRAFHRHVSKKGKLSLGLMITTDEEIGGKNGVQHLLAKEGYRPRLAILPDAGYNFGIVTLQYGILRISVRRKGKAAHTSRPEEGENAIESFQESFQRFRAAIAHVPETVSSLVEIKGGIAHNVVPDLCEAMIDVRTARADDVIKVVTKIFKKDEWKIVTNEPSYSVDPKHPVIETYRKVAASCLKKPVKLETLRGATDARFFAPYNIPAIVSAPKGGGHHQDNEWADLTSLSMAEDIAVKFLSNFEF
jgi:succinyl-diaminopimelate desuccinylase